MDYEKPHHEAKGIPHGVWSILIASALLTFSLFGFLTVLVVFLNDFLGFAESDSNSISAAFITVNYGFALLGGILSDSYLGDLTTVLVGGLFSVIGYSLVTIAAIPLGLSHLSLVIFSAIGLVLTAVGPGLLLPCFASMIANQFHPSQGKLITKFFSWYYLFIQVGAALSRFFGPVIQQKIGFAGLFTVLFVVMVLCILCVAVAIPLYKEEPPVASFVLWLVATVVYRSIVPSKQPMVINEESTLVSSDMDGITKENDNVYGGRFHFLDRAKGSFPSQTVEQVKCFLNSLIIFFPLPVFWALFFQIINTWVFQASRLNLSLWPGTKIQADQVGTLNPIFDLILIPVMAQLIYPLIEKCGLKFKPLYKACVGLLAATLGFLLAACLEIAVENTGDHAVSVYFQFPQYFTMSLAEVMVSIPAIDYAYEQAPKQMKTILQAMVFFVIGLGNILVVGISEISWPKQSIMFFVYSGLMLVFTILFIFLTVTYKPNKIP
eukprot:gb/GECH01008716.1/.p1 GENE.gb/GECH01008716.1/~~gb/GECH01008716.1/.p1  ORF type:complete len:493 (+),score=64.06 gb/GECH01008716.1/:1-1479(+)